MSRAGSGAGARCCAATTGSATGSKRRLPSTASTRSLRNVVDCRRGPFYRTRLAAGAAVGALRRLGHRAGVRDHRAHRAGGRGRDTRDPGGRRRGSAWCSRRPTTAVCGRGTNDRRLQSLRGPSQLDLDPASSGKRGYRRSSGPGSAIPRRGASRIARALPGSPRSSRWSPIPRVIPRSRRRSSRTRTSDGPAHSRADAGRSAARWRRPRRRTPSRRALGVQAPCLRSAHEIIG